jgi:hypothetical protein
VVAWFLRNRGIAVNVYRGALKAALAYGNREWTRMDANSLLLL